MLVAKGWGGATVPPAAPDTPADRLLAAACWHTCQCTPRNSLDSVLDIEGMSKDTMCLLHSLDERLIYGAWLAEVGRRWSGEAQRR